MADLVSLDMLRGRHLKIEGIAEDQDLLEKLRAAQEIVLTYVGRPEDADWTATIAAWTQDSVPKAIQAAILIQAGELFRFRGDDETGPVREIGNLTPHTVAILTAAGYRRPVVA